MRALGRVGRQDALEEREEQEGGGEGGRGDAGAEVTRRSCLLESKRYVHRGTRGR